MEYLERVEEDTIAVRSSPAPSLLETYSCSLRPFIISRSVICILVSLKYLMFKEPSWHITGSYLGCTGIYLFQMYKDTLESRFMRTLAKGHPSSEEANRKHFFNLDIKVHQFWRSWLVLPALYVLVMVMRLEMEDMQVAAKKPEAQWAGKLKLEKRSRWLLRAGRGEITPKKLEIEEKFLTLQRGECKTGWMACADQ